MSQHKPLHRAAGEQGALFKMHPTGHYYKGDLTMHPDGSTTFQPYDDDDARQPWNREREYRREGLELHAIDKTLERLIPEKDA